MAVDKTAAVGGEVALVYRRGELVSWEKQEGGRVFVVRLVAGSDSGGEVVTVKGER